MGEVRHRFRLEAWFERPERADPEKHFAVVGFEPKDHVIAVQEIQIIYHVHFPVTPL
jgi:hypothetical protein